MNELTPIDMPGTALAVIPASQVSTIIAADPNDILGKLAAKVAAHKPDVSTKRGRDEIRSLAAEIASNKATLIKIGKGLTEGWRKSTKAVNEECNILEERMDDLKERVRAPLTAFENAEKERVSGHEAALAAIVEHPNFGTTETSDELQRRLDYLVTYPWRDWQEFANRANAVLGSEIDRTAGLLAAAHKREDEAAELARLREAEAERQRQEAIRAAAERDRRIAAEAAEKARLAAEAEAQRLLAEEREASAKRERDAAEAARRAELAQAKAEQTAVEVARREEAKRVHEHHEAILVMRKLATPLTPPDPLPVIRAKIGQLRDVFENRLWDEFAEESAWTFADSIAALDGQMREAQAAEDQLQAGRVEAQRQAQAAAAAEATRAEQERVAAQARADKADAERRAANVAHRKRINGEALADILAAIKTVITLVAGCSEVPAEEIAKVVTVALAKGEVRHCKIEY